jgi:hypothetical protein
VDRVTPLNMPIQLNEVAPGLWEYNAPLSILGMSIGHRMTVARLTDKSLWVHSPVKYDAEVDAALAKIGRVAHIVAPNCIHDTYLEDWFAAFPAARFHGAPHFATFRPDLEFTDTLNNTSTAVWADIFDQHVLRGMPRLNEVVFLHRGSRTMILADLAFNLGPEMPFLSRVLLRLNDCYCKFGPSRMLRAVIKDREALRASLDHVFGWDFDRLIVSHGENIASGAKEKLREAFAFL